MQDDHGNKTVGFSAVTPTGRPEVPSVGGPDPARLQRMNEHMVRGIKYRERGEYVKVIDEFAAS
ncbi:hypothetical protein SAMN05444166_7332 [Singulisphaera sp. GP187]|uniref:hypothetical protein n=1 Tax=Singulisphaera sp. GP187 TaxID=1882752 RepID=UPI0009289B09|nr:hypothetical protein [Singulisphaera sp. GP187]SIO63389.1 hypothetical protein SAMN05444166_7332 [Singulisphaera sp. GP187]